MKRFAITSVLIAIAGGVMLVASWPTAGIERPDKRQEERRAELEALVERETVEAATTALTSLIDPAKEKGREDPDLSP